MAQQEEKPELGFTDPEALHAAAEWQAVKRRFAAEALQEALRFMRADNEIIEAARDEVRREPRLIFASPWERGTSDSGPSAAGPVPDAGARKWWVDLIIEDKDFIKDIIKWILGMP